MKKIIFFLSLFIPLFVNAQVEINDEYYERLKLADDKEIHNISRDQNTPSEVLDWIVDNKIKIPVHDLGILGNLNLSTEAIEKIINMYGKDAWKVYSYFVLHPNTKANTQIKIINAAISEPHKFVNLIRLLVQQGSELPPDIEQKMLRDFTYSHYQKFRKYAVLSPRLTPDLVAYFVNTEEIIMRVDIAQHPKISLEQLIILANDKYKPVQQAALSVLEERFPEKHEAVITSLHPHAGQSSESNLVHVLAKAIKRKDIASVEQVILNLKKYHPGLHYDSGIGLAIKVDDKKIAKLIFESFQQHQTIIDSLSKEENFSSQWLKFFNEYNLFDQFDTFEVMHTFLANIRLDLYWRMVLDGYEINPVNPKNNLSLLRSIMFSPIVILFSLFVIPFILVLGCNIFVLIKGTTTVVTSVIIILSSIVFFIATGIWVVIAGIGCWGCSEPFTGIIFAVLFYIPLLLTYFVLGRSRHDLMSSDVSS